MLERPWKCTLVDTTMLVRPRNCTLVGCWLPRTSPISVLHDGVDVVDAVGNMDVVIFRPGMVLGLLYYVDETTCQTRLRVVR